MNPIVFLDIDGVFNYSTMIESLVLQSIELSLVPFGDLRGFDFLNQLYEKKKFDIVISSWWRVYPNREMIIEKMYLSGLNPDIKCIGYTSYDSSSSFYGIRDQEIKDYIKKYSIEDYLIIDDDEINDKSLSKHHLLVNYEYGLDTGYLEEALQKLNTFK